MKIFSKHITIFIITVIVFTLNTVSSVNYSQELQDAYNFAYDYTITTNYPIEKADMYGELTRIAMAKMLSKYAINIQGKVPDYSKKISFSDVSDDLDNKYNKGVTLAYQLGIMGVGIDKFRPYDSVTRAEFGTALSRVLYGDKYNQEGKNYYSKHLNALNNGGIMTKIDNPSQKEIRGYVMLMLMRSKLINSNKGENLDKNLLELEEENTGNENYLESYNLDSDSYDYIVSDLGYKDRKLNIGGITCFNQIQIEKFGKPDAIVFIEVERTDNSNLEVEDVWFENLKGERVTRGDGRRKILNKEIFTDGSTASLVLCTKLKELYGSGYYSLGFTIRKVSNHITHDDDGYRLPIPINTLRYKVIKEKNKDENLSFTINGSEVRLEILEKNNEKCPTIFRKDEFYEIFDFIIHKNESDPKISLGRIELKGKGSRIKQWLKDLEIYVNGNKIDSRNYKWELPKYIDSNVYGEVQPLYISFDNIDINADTEIIIKGKFGGKELENKLEKYSHYNCLSGYWQAGFTTKFRYEKNNFIKLFDKKSGDLIPSEKIIIDDTGFLRVWTLNFTDNSKVLFPNEQHYIYTCDTLVDYNTTNTHTNYALGVGYGNSYEDNFGHCGTNNTQNNDNSSDENNSTDNSQSSNIQTNNETNNNENTSTQGDNTSTGNTTQNDENNNIVDDVNSIGSDNPEDLENCAYIKVDNGTSYCFNIKKVSGSKFGMSIDNGSAGEVYGCSIKREDGTNIGVFNSCSYSEFTILPSSGVHDFRVKLSYDGKEYSRKVSYDLTNGIFVNN